jgi:hypothetical protein
MKKGELEAIHQLSKNMYTCIGDAWSMITKKGAVEDVVRQLQSCQVISTGEMFYLDEFRQFQQSSCECSLCNPNCQCFS